MELHDGDSTVGWNDDDATTVIEDQVADEDRWYHFLHPPQQPLPPLPPGEFEPGDIVTYDPVDWTNVITPPQPVPEWTAYVMQAPSDEPLPRAGPSVAFEHGGESSSTTRRSTVHQVWVAYQGRHQGRRFPLDFIDEHPVETQLWDYNGDPAVTRGDIEIRMASNRERKRPRLYNIGIHNGVTYHYDAPEDPGVVVERQLPYRWWDPRSGPGFSLFGRGTATRRPDPVTGLETGWDTLREYQPLDMWDRDMHNYVERAARNQGPNDPGGAV